MISLRIEFLAGQFHGNPWDRGTNEGEIDWPPAPWRLLRALAAGWHRSGAGDRKTFVRVLDSLAEPPQYYLPRATAGHSRHYVPLGGLKGGKPEKTLMLDSFLTLERGREPVATAFVEWPRVVLPHDERAVLDRACVAIGYLGRAESWCSIQATDTPLHDGAELAFVDLVSRSNGGGPTTRRLAASPNLRGVELLRSLSETTADMRKAKRLAPPGTTWAEYRLPDDFLLVREQYTARNDERPSFGPTILRFNVERSASSILPSIAQAVSIAEIMRRAAMARYSKNNGGTATTRLAGKSEAGSGKREGHDHPFYLPSDSRSSGHVDRIDVWLPHGCTHAEYRALTSIDALVDRFAFDGALALTFLGSVEPTRAARWATATPLVLDRFPKIRGKIGDRRVVDAPEEQIRNMVERRFGVRCEVELWPKFTTVGRRGSHGIRLDAFRASRRGERPMHPVAAATIQFPTEIAGPIALGRLAHFGLGQFRPVRGSFPNE